MVFVKYKREKYMLGVGVVLGEGIREIERVYEYYKKGKEIGNVDKRKRSVREMRERNREYERGKCEEDSKELTEEDSKELTEEDQLKYIMPKEILKEMGIEKEWDEEVSYEWAYCDHFWEADVIVTRIPKK
jgi:uncharacterized protein (DUF1786 family)